MITKKQKRNFVILSLVSIICGLLAIVPFTTLFNRLGLKVESVTAFELVFKLIDLPILILLFSRYALIILNKQLDEGAKYTVSAVKMTYFPSVVYFTGLLAWIVGIVYASGTLKTSMKALIAVIVFVCGAIFLNLVLALFTNWVSKLTKKAMKIVNICFIVLFFLILIAVYVVYSNTPVINVLASKWAMLEMVVCLLVFGLICVPLFRAIYSDETIKIRLGAKETFTDEQAEKIIEVEVEDNLAKDFNEFYEANKGKILEEKPVEEETIEPETEETKEESETEELKEESKETTEEEKAVEETLDETPTEEGKEEVEETPSEENVEESEPEGEKKNEK